MRNRLGAIAVAVGAAFASAAAQAARSGYAAVNGLDMHYAVELFRLLGGAVPGDLAGRPRAQLAVLPGTKQVSLVERADWLTPMVAEFLDAPMPEAK
jgi:hypothetical protein